MNWELLIDEDAPGTFLPPVFVRYRRPLERVLALFPEGLSAERQEAIAMEQAKLSSALG